MRLLFCMLLAGCSQPGALVVVTVDAEPALATSKLRGTATLGTRSKDFSLDVAGGMIPPKLIFGIELPADASGSLDLTLSADGSSRTAHGSVAVAPHGRADLPIRFSEDNNDLGPSDMSLLVDLFDSDGLPRVSRRYVINHFTLPLMRTDFAYDLNGDGRLDNQYGNIESAAMSIGLSGQGDMTAATLDQQLIDEQVATGQFLLLLEHQSTDVNFQSDPFARVIARRASMHANPVFDGSGAFTVNTSIPSSRFDGTLTGAQFSSSQVATTTAPVDITLPLSWFGGYVEVPLTGAHIEYQITPAGLMVGRIQGAIPKSVLDTMVTAGATMGIQGIINANPTSMTSMQLLQIFDIGDPGGCDAGFPPRDLAGVDGGSVCVCAVPNDKLIDVCEFAQNSIIRNILNPDVDLFDDGGTWMPSSANTGKDSFSVAVGFTAVPASF